MTGNGARVYARILVDTPASEPASGLPEFSLCVSGVGMAGSDQIWSEAVRILERNKQFVLATVVNVRGSTPREVGAKMIVHNQGQFGTIGGGCGEAEVFRKARLLLEEDAGAQLT